MNSLTVIKEECEDEIPEDSPELVQRLMAELKRAQHRAQEYEERLLKIETSDSRIKELTNLCQSKTAEIFALERKVKDLTTKNEEKDKQIISMIMMAKEFKELVESEDKAVQTDVHNSWDAETRLIESHEKNTKLKDVMASQFDEINRFKSVDSETRESINSTETREPMYSASARKKIETKVKPGGYYPLFLRKPKESY